MAKPAIHYQRNTGYTACGWIAKRVTSTPHHIDTTCINCLKVINGHTQRRPRERAEARRGGTNTGLGHLHCRLCGKPYANHKDLNDHG